jgi:hypothetical protein
MPKLKYLLLSPIIVTSVIANIAAVAAQGPDHFHKNEHLLHAEKRQYLRALKNNLHPGSNKAKRGTA